MAGHVEGCHEPLGWGTRQAGKPVRDVLCRESRLTMAIIIWFMLILFFVVVLVFICSLCGASCSRGWSFSLLYPCIQKTLDIVTRNYYLLSIQNTEQEQRMIVENINVRELATHSYVEASTKCSSRTSAFPTILRTIFRGES